MILAYLIDTPPEASWHIEIGEACKFACIAATKFNYPVTFEFNEVTVHAYPGECIERIQARYWEGSLQREIAAGGKVDPRYKLQIEFLLRKAREKEHALSVTAPTLSPLR